MFPSPMGKGCGAPIGASMGSSLRANGSGAALALLLEIAQAALGNAKRFMDRLAQIGMLKFAFEMFGLVADDPVLMAGNTELDPHHRRNSARGVLRPLVDANAAGNQAAIQILQVGDTVANEFLRPFLAFGIVERDFQGHLHGCLRQWMA